MKFTQPFYKGEKYLIQFNESEQMGGAIYYFYSHNNTNCRTLLNK